VVKLSYLQTIALSQGLINANNLETEGSSQNLGGKSSNKTSLNPTFAPFIGIGKKSSSSNTTVDTSGLKLKDQWLQPYFDRIRYTIGIRELVAAKYTFAEKSELISVPYVSPKEIIKVYVNVDEYVPPQFDKSQNWIRYYIKSEGTDQWVEIAPFNLSTRFNDAGDIIPKIVNFNVSKPTVVGIEDKFNYTEQPVTKLRFKAVLSRPLGGDNESITPILKSYKMIMTPRT
jgi:hypothetical protein